MKYLNFIPKALENAHFSWSCGKRLFIEHIFLASRCFYIPLCTGLRNIGNIRRPSVSGSISTQTFICSGECQYLKCHDLDCVFARWNIENLHGFVAEKYNCVLQTSCYVVKAGPIFSGSESWICALNLLPTSSRCEGQRTADSPPERPPAEAIQGTAMLSPNVISLLLGSYFYCQEYELQHDTELFVVIVSWLAINITQSFSLFSFIACILQKILSLLQRICSNFERMRIQIYRRMHSGGIFLPTIFEDSKNAIATFSPNARAVWNIHVEMRLFVLKWFYLNFRWPYSDSHARRLFCTILACNMWKTKPEEPDME